MQKLGKKKTIICSLAVGTTSVALLIGSLVGLTVCGKKRMDILEQNGYEEANTQYKAEVAVDLSEQYKNGEIDDNEYNAKLLKIEDLNKAKFLEENASQETYKKYKNYTKIETISATAVLPEILVGGGGIGLSLGLLNISYRQNRKESKDAEIELK